MKHIDLFSGIGGFSLAASWVWGEEHHIHSFVEIDQFCQKVLKKHWPTVP
ncbi:MAG: DNA cytosine methyltransferase, partial [Candidatus Omnitrophota bacterium]